MTVTRLPDRRGDRVVHPPLLVPGTGREGWRPRPGDQNPRLARDGWGDLWGALRGRGRAGDLAMAAVVAALAVLALRAGIGGLPGLATGLAAVAALTITLVRLAGMEPASRVSGVETGLRSHRWLGLASLALVLAHLGSSLAERPPAAPGLFSPGVPPSALAAATTGVAIALLAVLAAARRRLQTRYELWRGLHVVLALTAAAGTVLHVGWLDRQSGDVATHCGLAAAALAVAGAAGRRWLRGLARTRAAFVVQSVRLEPTHNSALVLAPARRRRSGPAFRPGQIAWLRLDRPWGPCLPHMFTVASADRPGHLEFALANADGPAPSAEVFAAGRRVYVDGPHDPVDDHHQGSLLLVAAQRGITSSISILRTQAARRDPRPHCLILSATTQPEPGVRSQLRELRKHLDLDIVEILSEPERRWTGRRGAIDGGLLQQVLRQRPSLTAPHAYVCGPPQMVSDVHAALLDLGLSGHRIHPSSPAPV